MFFGHNLIKNSLACIAEGVDHFYRLLGRNLEFSTLRDAHRYFEKKDEVDYAKLRKFRDNFLRKNLLPIAHRLAKNKMLTKPLEDITAEYTAYGTALRLMLEQILGV